MVGAYQTMTQLVIFDCDNAMGLPARDVDDGLALLFLLSQPGITLQGITTCFGNAPLPAVLAATQRLIDFAGIPGMPLLAGASGRGTAPTEAAHFLVEATAREPGRIVILACGPLTNLAAAAALDPGFFGRCARIICMGGTVGQPRLGWRRLREINFAADPDAARQVLATRECLVHVVPATSCLDLKVGAADLAQLNPVLRRVLWRWLVCCWLGRGLDHFVAWDLLAVLTLTHSELVEARNSTVALGKGGVLSLTPDGHHALVLGLRDAEAVRALLLNAWTTDRTGTSQHQSMPGEVGSESRVSIAGGRCH
ncbi:MAG: nucleoside hydrolase [Proteobacteria bacterium]|nr:MAG: nucleoside hydrolase [Pseudomonadota bacterium]